MAKRKFEVKHSCGFYDKEKGQHVKGHYFATSLGEWRVHEDKEVLIRQMKAGGMNFSVLIVPLPIDAHYAIENFFPDVEGCALIEAYKIKE